jgi:hypothetical protein
MHRDWERRWAEMTDEERRTSGVIIIEQVLSHGKLYRVDGRDSSMVTIREDGFIAGTIQIDNDKPMTRENFIRLLAELARAAKYFEWTNEDRKKGRAPVLSFTGEFMRWGSEGNVFTEYPEEEASEQVGGSSLQSRDSGAVRPALPGPQSGVSEPEQVLKGILLPGEVQE